MATAARIRELGARHRNIEMQIDDEISRPVADATRLTELKRQKLRLKEQMEGLRALVH